MMLENILKYKTMIELFLAKEIAIEDFEKQFFDTYKKDCDRQKPVSEVLSWFFYSLDSYVPAEIPRSDPPISLELSEEEVRRDAVITLNKLNALIEEHNLR